jgi:hypothetical protein
LHLLTHLPSCACPLSRLGPLPARKSAGLSPDGRALSGSIPFTLGYAKKINAPEGTFIFFGEGEGNRTRVSSLGSWCSAIELHPHVFFIITQILKKIKLFMTAFKGLIMRKHVKKTGLILWNVSIC